jgi:hypothetical protein
MSATHDPIDSQLDAAGILLSNAELLPGPAPGKSSHKARQETSAGARERTPVLTIRQA